MIFPILVSLTRQLALSSLFCMCIVVVLSCVFLWFFSFIEVQCVSNTGSTARILHRKASADLSADELREYLLTQGSLTDHSLSNLFCNALPKMGISDFFSSSTRSKICFGGRFAHQHVMDYSDQFFQNYEGQLCNIIIFLDRSFVYHPRSFVSPSFSFIRITFVHLVCSSSQIWWLLLFFLPV